MIAPMAAYLASDDAWNINGYCFAVAGGSVSVLHHPTAMRTIWKPAMWTVDELIDMVPRHLLAGVQRPPPQSTASRDPELIAPMAAYLASDDAWNINGYMFGVAGGSVSVLHHPTAMRTLWKPGMWTVDELIEQVPRQLMAGIANPAPPPPDLEIPGRLAPVSQS